MPIPTKLPVTPKIEVPTRITEVGHISAQIEFECEGELLKGSVEFSDCRIASDAEPVVRQVTIANMQRWFVDPVVVCITHVDIDNHTYKVYDA